MHRRIGRWYVRKLLEGMSTSEALLVRKAYRLARMALQKLLEQERSSYYERMCTWTRMAEEVSMSMFQIKKKRSRSFRRRNSSDDGASLLEDENKQKSKRSDSSVNNRKKKGRMTFRPI